jgi:hypothetical protein
MPSTASFTSVRGPVVLVGFPSDLKRCLPGLPIRGVAPLAGGATDRTSDAMWFHTTRVVRADIRAYSQLAIGHDERVAVHLSVPGPRSCLSLRGHVTRN